MGLLLIGALAIAIAAAGYFGLRARAARREAFIRSYTFPKGLFDRLAKARPELAFKDIALTSHALRQFFLAYLRSGRLFVSMPSQVADDLWHEFILHTRNYELFCRHAFGGFLHHTPAVALGADRGGNAGLRRTWWWCCREENIDPRRPSRLPLLFALDGKLGIADGFRYRADCGQRPGQVGRDEGGMTIYCGTSFGDSAFDGAGDGIGMSTASVPGPVATWDPPTAGRETALGAVAAAAVVVTDRGPSIGLATRSGAKIAGSIASTPPSRSTMTLQTDARIPTIDFTGWRSGTAEQRATLVDAIGDAAQVYGFMLIVGHGIDPAVLRGGFDAGGSFFQLAEPVKRTMQETGSDRGYQPMFDNLRADGKPSAQEGFTMGHPVAPSDPVLAAEAFHAPTPWPPVDDFRVRFETLYDAMFDLGRDLLGAMALHLGAEAGFFEHALVDTYSHMRINHYPPHETVSHVADEGVFAHHDESLITLLLQDGNSGLEVMGRDGAWIAVAPHADAVVVNVGKMLRHWTGGRYNAALHQVINLSGRDRYSIPLFVHPGLRTVVDPSDLVGPGDGNRAFPPLVAGEAVRASFASTRASWQDTVRSTEPATTIA